MVDLSWLRSRLSEVLIRRGRTPGLRTAKSTIAAVVSYVIAGVLQTSPDKILAPLTALLVVQVTMYQTVAQGLERIVSVLVGVLVAVGVAAIVGLSWWSLGLVVAGSLLLGRLLRLGPNLLEVPISAMLILAVGGNDVAARGRVVETLIGASVAVVVNLVIAPPLYAQPAGDAVRELSERMSRLLREQAEILRTGWSRPAADRWLEEARRLGTEVTRADRVLGQAEESARLNPRAGVVKAVRPRLRIALDALEHLYVGLRALSRAMQERTYFVPPEEQATVYGEEIRDVLAGVFNSVADAIEAVGSVATDDAGQERVESAFAELEKQRTRLGQLLLVDPSADPAAWQQHGALLTVVDRLRAEAEAAVRPPDEPWQPPRLTERQRRAVRRLLLDRRRRKRGAVDTTGPPNPGPDPSEGG